MSYQEEYESGKAIVENIQQKLRAFRGFRPSVQTSEASSSTPKLSLAPEEKTEAQNVKVMIIIMDIHMSNVVEDAFHNAM